MKLFSTILALAFCFSLSAQDTVSYDTTNVIVHKDPRVDMLIKKQAQINETTVKEARRTARGYRLLVINTNQRDEAIAAKTKVYTFFPELKAYLIYQSPYFKVKVGNFRERKEADDYRQLLSAYFPRGVFVIHDIIEIRPDRDEDR